VNGGNIQAIQDSLKQCFLAASDFILSKKRCCGSSCKAQQNHSHRSQEAVSGQCYGL
jgi:hypothetical protein